MIHFDHAATSLPRVPVALAAALAAADLPSAGRGRHSGQSAAIEIIDEARSSIAGLVGGGRVVFNSGTTYGLNQAINGLAWNEAAVDPLLHDAARLPLMRARRPLWVMPADRDGRLDLARMRDDWHGDLVVVGHGSNVNGVVQPVAELVELAHHHGARVIVDAAQTAGVVALDEVLERADIVCFSAHKGLRALPGTGAMVVRGDLHITPLVVGGTGSGGNLDNDELDLPQSLEAGTVNLPGIAAIGAAARAFAPWPVADRTRALLEAVRRAKPGHIWSGELPTVSFAYHGIDPYLLEDSLDRGFGIATRAGTHCAPLAHTTLSSSATLRVSAGACTTDADLEALASALLSITHALR